MKKNIFKYTLSLFVCLLTLWSCEEELVDYDDEVIELTTADGLIKIATPAINIEEGVEEYTIQFVVVKGVQDIATVNVYKTFTEGASGEISDTILAFTYDIDQSKKSTIITETLTFAELIENVQLDGTKVPEAQDSLKSGSQFDYFFEVLDSEGNAVNTTDEDTKNINLQFLPNPYKGTYKVIFSDYWRIERLCIDAPCDREDSDLPWDWTVGNPDGENSIKKIVALNDTALAMPDWWGPFAWDGQLVFYTRIYEDPPPTDSSFNIIIPTEIDGEPVPTSVSGWNIITCEKNPAAFNHSRGCLNILVPDAGGPGVHRIYLTYGYISPGGDEREFYEVLERIGE